MDPSVADRLHARSPSERRRDRIVQARLAGSAFWVERWTPVPSSTVGGFSLIGEYDQDTPDTTESPGVPNDRSDDDVPDSTAGDHDHVPHGSTSAPDGGGSAAGGSDGGNGDDDRDGDGTGGEPAQTAQGEDPPPSHFRDESSAHGSDPEGDGQVASASSSAGDDAGHRHEPASPDPQSDGAGEHAHVAPRSDSDPVWNDASRNRPGPDWNDSDRNRPGPQWNDDRRNQPGPEWNPGRGDQRAPTSQTGISDGGPVSGDVAQGRAGLDTQRTTSPPAPPLDDGGATREDANDRRPIASAGPPSASASGPPPDPVTSSTDSNDAGQTGATRRDSSSGAFDNPRLAPYLPRESDVGPGIIDEVNRDPNAGLRHTQSIFDGVNTRPDASADSQSATTDDGTPPPTSLADRVAAGASHLAANAQRNLGAAADRVREGVADLRDRVASRFSSGGTQDDAGTDSTSTPPPPAETETVETESPPSALDRARQAFHDFSVGVGDRLRGRHADAGATPAPTDETTRPDAFSEFVDGVQEGRGAAERDDSQPSLARRFGRFLSNEPSHERDASTGSTNPTDSGDPTAGPDSRPSSGGVLSDLLAGAADPPHAEDRDEDEPTRARRLGRWLRRREPGGESGSGEGSGQGGGNE